MTVLSPDQFEALLRHLGPDRETAGRQYEQLRRRLLTVFTYRRCPHPEELADETLDRVASKLLEMGPKFEGPDPTRFVFGVAWNIAKESFHRPGVLPLPAGWDIPAVAAADDPIHERGESCLDQCLRSLAEPDRGLVLRYHQEEKRAKIAERSTLARELGITRNALRLRVHRLTQQLRDCMVKCLEAGEPRPLGLG